MFIQYLAEQGVRSLAAERKQRKTVQYKDLGNLAEHPLSAPPPKKEKGNKKKSTVAYAWGQQMRWPG